MTNARNWYLYIATAISLHGVLWAIISLLRLLFIGGSIDKTSLALQLSIIIIGLPVYLVHWLWAQRLALKDRTESHSIQRQLFIFGTLAGTLSPFLNSVFQLFNQGLILRESNALVTNIIPIFVLPIIFGYHLRVQRMAFPSLKREDTYLTLEQIFTLGFALGGLGMLYSGGVSILRISFFHLTTELFGNLTAGLGTEILRLVIGVIVWGLFWNLNQKILSEQDEGDLDVFRWAYLYLVVVTATIGTVVSTSMLLNEFLRSLLDLAREVPAANIYPSLVMMGLIWSYHALVIQRTDPNIEVADKKARIQWLYHYLVSLIGFLAFIIAITGLLHIFIKVILIGNNFDQSIRADFSIFLSMVAAGLPTWIISWRKIYLRTQASEGLEERSSSIRKFYLYLIILAATITVMQGLIYFIYQFLLRVLGQADFPSFFQETAVFIANVIVAGIVLFYYWKTLRTDNKLIKKVEVTHWSEEKVVLLQDSQGAAVSILEALQEAFPGMPLSVINPLSEPSQTEELSKLILSADLILLPMGLISQTRFFQNQILNSVFESSGKKILVPQEIAGFEWVGVERMENKKRNKKTVKTVEKVLAGEENITDKPFGCSSIIGIIVGFMLILFLSQIILSSFLGR